MKFSIPVVLSAVGLAAAKPLGPTTVDNSVIYGNARFTLISDTVVRMEHSDRGVFEDRQTMLVATRRFDAIPDFKTSVVNDTSISIQTGKDDHYKYFTTQNSQKTKEGLTRF